MPAMPAQKHSYCMKPEQADPSKLAQPESMGTGGQDCKVFDQQSSGSSYSWKVSCAGKQAMEGEGQTTFGPDSYTTVMKMTGDFMGDGRKSQMTQRMSGRRLGDCK